jgi:hypothetical protein
LAARACARLLKELQTNGGLPRCARLFVGDSVGVHRTNGVGVLKGADLHVLVNEERTSGDAPHLSVAGVVEVKSYVESQRRLRAQLDQHLRRAKQGLRIGGVDYPAEMIGIGCGESQQVARIVVLPSDWRLARSFRFTDSATGRLLDVDRRQPPRDDDEIARGDGGEWRITLRWSVEALAEAAYEMTFWYMEKVGEVIYSTAVPRAWEGMTPAEAGRNAVKMMLYYAILRCRTPREEERAIALYNTYAFGYALGMNYRNAHGRREMLWPQDLDEIVSAGKTKSGCRLC